jgi:hypothetical protein
VVEYSDYSDTIKLTVLEVEMNPVTDGEDTTPYNPAIVAPVDYWLFGDRIDANSFRVTDLTLPSGVTWAR